jgi:5-methylcytosine-specific restriction protein A
MSDEFYFLDKKNTDPKRVKKEREKARELRASAWWKQKLVEGICHYCGAKFAAKDLTMDHLVPIARGGLSGKNNLVPACKECNAKKKLDTPVDQLLKQIAAERKPEEN